MPSNEPSNQASAQPPRDSLFSERVVWEGKPEVLRVPATYQLASWVLGVTALVTTLFFVASSRAVHHGSASMLLTAFWAATVYVLVRSIPLIWVQEAKFVITDRHVIWQRGRFKRMIQRDGISFARIRWYKRVPTVGDIDLVRAVPTGALRRKLAITLQGVRHPDRVWSLVLQTPPPKDEGGYATPLPRRLGSEEELLWQAQPTRSWKTWLPLEGRRWGNALLGLLVAASSLRTLLLATPLARRLVHAGVAPSSLEFVSLFGAMGFTVALLLGFGMWLMYRGILQSPRDDRHTNYYLTPRRLVVQVRNREVHVVLSHVVDLIDKPNRYGSHDVYLVLDGPRARAFSVLGAFGSSSDDTTGLQPVLRRLDDGTRQHLHDVFRKLEETGGRIFSLDKPRGDQKLPVISGGTSTEEATGDGSTHEVPEKKDAS